MEDKIIEIFVEALEIEGVELTGETRFRDLEQWDSLAYLSLISLIDDDLGVVVETDEFKKLNTIAEVTAYLSAKV